MKFGKKIVAAVLAAATALTALSASAFAADPIGTNPTILKDGVQSTFQIPYNDNGDYNDGHNYKDLSFDVPTDGQLKLTFDAAIDKAIFTVYRDDTKETIDYDYKIGTGEHENYSGTVFAWSSSAGLFSGEIFVDVTKGKYDIRITRFLRYGYGANGNGRVHLTAEMVKPDAPGEIQIVEKTDTTAKLQWREPEGCTSYDLRYKTGSGDWTTVKDIMDNNVTIKKLKGATKYTYQMRSHAGEIVGDWSKAASFKTSDPKNVKFDVPKVNASVAVHITWGAVKNATGYKFQYSTDQKNWKTITVEEPAADMPVTSGKTYYYKVAAKNSAKTGSFSKVSSIKIG